MSKKETPWALGRKVAEALAEVLADRMKQTDDAMALSTEIGKLCNGKEMHTAEMALCVVLAHILSEYKPPHRQRVFNRICDQIITISKGE